jgi:Glycosyl hydrolase catalytic core
MHRKNIRNTHCTTTSSPTTRTKHSRVAIAGRNALVLLVLFASSAVLSCGGTGGESTTPNPTPSATRSAKRGIAYDLASPADFAALAPGVSWWYNWSPHPNASVPADYASRYDMDFYPMLWNGHFNADDVKTFLRAHASIKYILVLNEPNLVDQANLTPQQAAQLWPQFEAIAAETGVEIVGPAITWGTMPGYEDPVQWLDAFYAAYRAANGNRDPRIDYLAFHWYDYGLAGQLDRLAKYRKPYWVTEFANWHSQADGAQIDALAKQEAQMADMVATCEGRTDVFRYAWFTGRWSPDRHFTSLLGADGVLTELGKRYLALPTH